MPFLPHHRRRQIAVTALAAALALTATGCLGGDDKAKGPFDGKPDREIIDTAIAATKSARSLTLTAEGSIATTRTKKKEPLKLRIAVHQDGRCSGTMSVAGQGSVEFAGNGKDTYLRPDEQFLRFQLKQPDEDGPGVSGPEADGVVKLMKGKWHKADPAEPDSKDFTEFCDVDSLLADFGSGTTAGVKQAGEAAVDGRKTLKFTQGAKNEEELHVATEGKPYVLKLTGTPEDEKDGELMTAVLSDFDKAPLPKIPAPAEIADPDKLG
ncbi:hypothetical protein ACWD4V_04455 [Streptomyces tsukubensis]